jgi:hypothetical protein
MITREQAVKGTRVMHPRLGAATVEETFKQFHPHAYAFGTVFINLDNPPENWAKVVEVELDMLDILT